MLIPKEMAALIAIDMARLVVLMMPPVKRDNPTVNIAGASTAAPTTAQTTNPINDHSWRTILARRVCEKSGPLNPMVRATIPTAKRTKKPSREAVIATGRLG